MSVDTSKRKKRAPEPHVTRGKAMIVLFDVRTKIERLAINGTMLNSERACYKVALAIIDKAIGELSR